MKGKICNEQVSANTYILSLFEMSLYYGLTIFLFWFLCQVKKNSNKCHIRGSTSVVRV